MRVLAAVALVTIVAVSACRHASGAVVQLDGSPRIADDEGIATVVSRSSIVLDGKRAYRVDSRFVSFSTYTGELQPMTERLGQYVQIGVRNRRAVWMAGIAAVITRPAPAVYYAGRLDKVDNHHRAVFADGTVLHVAPGVVAPATGRSRVLARIDPGRHQVVEFIAS